MKPDPLGVPRHPLVVYLLGLCVVSGLAIVVGGTAAGSLQAQLDPVAQYAWAGILAAGSSCTLAGMYWPADPRTGLLLKRWGYTALAIAAAIYSLVLWGTFGPAAFLIGATVAGFAVACGLTARDVNRAIRTTLP